MFKIGEFSKIAQVSGRLLRYYDDIGLLKPRYIDQWSGYRYYMADQLPRLNRILALKELGLSLEQIQQLLDEGIGTNDIRKLYLERKAQIEQSLQDELARLQQVQLRLNQLECHEVEWMPDIIIKSMPPQSILGYRDSKMVGTQLYQLFDLLIRQLSERATEKSRYGSLLTVLYSEMLTPEADMDIEIGFTLNNALNSERVKPLMIAANVMLTVRELPAVEQMATIIHQGLDDHPLTYNALGRWLERHHYRIVGPGRELLLENYYPEEPEKCILEIQIPVERVNLAEFNFLESAQ